MSFIKHTHVCWFLFLIVGNLLMAQEPAAVQHTTVQKPMLIPAPDAPPPAAHSAFPLISKRAASVSQFEIDTSNREAVRLFYNAVYFASEGVDMGWTGNYISSDAGDISADYREATRLRINFFRAMSGVPSWISFDSTYNEKNQQAAFMMSGEGILSHMPPISWNYYTVDGAEAAAKSNIALGTAGPESVTGYMRDHGLNNKQVGHRKWLLHPPHQTFGSGDVPGNQDISLISETFPQGQTPIEANTITIFDGNTNNAYPSTRDGFVAWPPKGYVPYTLVFARWSFGVEGGDLSQATVTLSQGDTPIPVTIDYQSSGDTLDHLVWVPEGKDTSISSDVYEKPEVDIPYTVKVQSVLINDSPQSFTYNVTLFDPAVATPESTPTLVSGTDHLAVGASTAYLLRGDPQIDGLQWRKVNTTTFNSIFNAESGLNGLTAETGPYDPYAMALAASGSYSYRLGILDENATGPQSLTLNDTLVPSANSVLTFKSRVGLIATLQTANVEVSTDGGNQWESLWQKSISSSGELESSYQNESIDLGSYAGSPIHIRFIFRTKFEFYFITLDDPNIIHGWAFDNISISNADKFSNISEGPVIDGRSFQITSNSAESFLLQVRPRVFGDFFLQWGQLIPLQASEQGGGNNGFATLPSINGWQETVFGWINTNEWPWAYHLEHGWIYSNGNANGLYCYDQALASWTYLSPNYYPWMYHYNLKVWIRHQPVTTVPDRWFWAVPGSISGQLSSGWIQEKDF